MSSTNTPFKAIIVGGGPVGLAAAHSLHLAGIDFLILERRPAIIEDKGASLIVHPHTLRVFDQFGILDDVLPHGTELNHHLSFTADGHVFAESNRYNLVRENHGHGPVAFHRAELIKTMYNGLPDQAKQKILTNKSLADITTTSDSVTATCADGSTYHGSILIGADGVNSKSRHLIRSLALQEDPTRSWDAENPYTATYQLLFGSFPSPAPAEAGQGYDIQSKNKAIMYFNGPERGWFFLYKRLPAPMSSRTIYTQQDVEDVASEFAEFPLTRTVKVKDVWPRMLGAGLTNLDEGIVKHWSFRRVVLVGDACHKMTTHLGLGFNNGIQDVVVLSNRLRKVVRAAAASGSGGPSAQELKGLFEEYQNMRMSSVCSLEGDVVKSGLETRMHAWHNVCKQHQGPFHNTNCAMANRETFALITGCSSGIGKELAVAFANRGVTVLGTARRTQSLDELTSKYSNIKALALDLSDPEIITKLKDSVLDYTDGYLDYLVNNAGTHYAGTAMDLEMDEVVAIFQVNVFAVMRLCQIFLPLLRQSPRGRIVQIESVTWNIPVVWQGAYNASKAALSQYSRTLRLVSTQVKPLGVEVIEIVTGFVQSNILHHGLHAPEDSVYLPIKGIIENIKYQGNANGMPAHVYAASITDKLLRRQVDPEIWEGKMARLLRLIFMLPLRLLGAPLQHPSTTSPSCSRHLPFSSQDEEHLIECFFDIAQDANPIYSKKRFLHRYRSSQCSQDLITAVALIAANLTQFSVGDGGPNLDAELDSLLSSSLLEDDLVGDTPSLDQFRKAYILALYEFHQFPGHHSWLRIGRVTRMAYRIGLDRLEHIRVLYADWSTVSDEDIQEWRALWWRIYRLDTYANLASGTPYLIDDTLIDTSFNLSQTANPSHAIFLPPNSAGLAELLPAITSDPETLLDNIHNITIASMRQAGLMIRIHMLRWQAGMLSQITAVDRQLTTLRLALPPGWLNPHRNAFINESPLAHHARLITVYHLRMAQLLLSVAECSARRADDWLSAWQRVLETCQDIAGLASQWDSAYCMTVDPAITFTIFTTLIFLDLQRKCELVATDDLRSSIDHDITVLHLQLKHFGTIWTQARLLTLSFESFSESVTGPLAHNHIALILSRFESPLHPRWLQFLASARPALEACH
ncbi:transcriptional regulator family: Fungal Specific TF [Aspergillus niger]|nr:transcriptional regulator family: Fungal Specific TF [Aspergillus niger]KAI2901061.1 transcriptional regulator family: Fungal Specific TF [Aspergillus niger]KAI2901973.1 transcriptional regulator family: Fungal Specific TF [Aspergillus niger]KAI2954791.1 transcriptional regulator family: Fungal Specific TF [Aspergillus niger]KAI2965796.1 transcriptional regulator family: Fungal Specific TF [Aspergillus niger]